MKLPIWSIAMGILCGRLRNLEYGDSGESMWGQRKGELREILRFVWVHDREFCRTFRMDWRFYCEKKHWKLAKNLGNDQFDQIRDYLCDISFREFSYRGEQQEIQIGVL